MFITDALNYYSGDYLFQEKGYASGETLINEISQFSLCRALIEEAQNAIQEQGLDPLKVCIEPTKSGFDAEKDFNVIRIRPGLLAAQQRDRLVFELTNIIHHKTFMEIWRLAVNGTYKNPEEFARDAEFIEFKGMKRRNFISKAMNKERGRFFRSYFANPWENFPIETMSFDRYYSSYLANNHKEHYREGLRSVNNFYNRETDSTNKGATHKTVDNESSYSNCFNNILKIALGVSLIAIACLKWG